MIGLCDFFETIEIEQLDEHVTKDVDGDTYHQTDCGNHLVKVCSWGNMCSSGSLGHHQPPILTTQCMPAGPHASCMGGVTSPSILTAPMEWSGWSLEVEACMEWHSMHPMPPFT